VPEKLPQGLAGHLYKSRSVLDLGPFYDGEPFLPRSSRVIAYCNCFDHGIHSIPLTATQLDAGTSR